MRHFELPGNTKKEKFYPNSAFLFQKLEINTFQGVESNKQWLLWWIKIKEIYMSVARINMVDWRSEELFVEKTKNTASTMRQSFPNAEIMLRIKTTPTSVVAISVYPSQEKADEARAELDKRMADYGDAVKDHWFLEGEVISAHINEEWVKNSIKR